MNSNRRIEAPSIFLKRGLKWKFPIGKDETIEKDYMKRNNRMEAKIKPKININFRKQHFTARGMKI